MPHRSRLKWFIWCLAVLFYFYEFVLRVSPGVMVPELMKAFDVTAYGVSIISAFYLYAYAPMQIPVGVLIDKLGLKKLLSSASILCGIGAILFSLSAYFSLACMGRFLIGAASAFAFVSMVYISSHWFSKRYRALLIGLANSIAMIGAICGTGPLANVVIEFGWRQTIAIIGFFGIVIGIAIYFALSEDVEATEIEELSAHKTHSFWNHLSSVLVNKQSWLNAFIAIMFYISTTVLGGLWGIPFIEKAYNVNKETAGYAISMIFTGWLFGGPVIGYISDCLKNRLLVLRVCMLCTLLALITIIYFTMIPIWAVFLITFLIGLFSSAELLNFLISIEVNSLYVKATAIAFVNCLVSFGDSIAQPLIGWLIDFRWKGHMHGGIPLYSTGDYQFALSILPIALIVGIFISFLLREKAKTN